MLPTLLLLILQWRTANASIDCKLSAVIRHDLPNRSLDIDADNFPTIVATNLDVKVSPLRAASNAAFREGIVAAIAGVAQVLLLMWLRTALSYQYRYGVSLSTALTELYANGGILRLYRGLGFALVQGPLSRFCSIYANQASLVLSESHHVSNAVATASGAILAMMFRLILIPIDTLKTVLQVEGREGYNQLIQFVLKKGKLNRLYSGAISTMVISLVAHYPWFYIHNVLDKTIKKEEKVTYIIARSAAIGFLATVVSDTVSNVFRVIKTNKQSLALSAESYLDVVYRILEEGGIKSLFFRGLSSKIIMNCIQSIVFTVIWKLLPLYLA